MLSLADQNVVESMLSGDDGVFGSLRDGGYIVDMSTVPPDFARELAERAKDAGYHALDACVLRRADARAQRRAARDGRRRRSRTSTRSRA